MLETMSTSHIQTMNSSMAISFPPSTNAVIENIKCYVRCRPMNQKERDIGAGCIKLDLDNNSILVDNKTESKNAENKPFTMDLIFDETIRQEEIFETVAVPVLTGYLNGYNCTIFAYGQTGAGKTHTMLGPLDAIFDNNSTKHGILPRILQFIFAEDQSRIKKILSPDEEISGLKMEIKCSCLEIYQEQIIDLLATSTSAEDMNKLVVREDSKRGMFIEGLTEMSVKSDISAKELIMLGLKNRHVAATSMNAESSRSHLIFSIFLSLVYSQPDGCLVSRTTRLHLIDLAGSERQKATKAVGDRLKEAGMINKSLSTLGNVINALVEMSEGKTKYVPFRDSRLTYFLKDSLGGNSKTTIIANISQSVIQIQETISTLKFVQRAKMIKNKATANENVNDAVKVLHTEIKRLKDELTVYSNKNVVTVDYICPICNNDKGRLNQNQNEPAGSSQMNSTINSLMAKVDNLFVYENIIVDKFRLIDSVATSSIEKFFMSKDNYEKEYFKLIEILQNKINQLNSIIGNKEVVFKDIQKGLEKFEKDNIINNLFVDKINSLTDELLIFKSDFELNDKLSLIKLSEENKQLKNEVETFKYIKEYFMTKAYKDTKVEKEFYSKENLEKMNGILGEFVDTNKSLKDFFLENFNVKSEKFTSSQGEDFVLVDKKQYEKLKFQLEEFALKENSNEKLIDDLQSENFLLNMEIAKYKRTNKEVESSIDDNNSVRSDSPSKESDDEKSDELEEKDSVAPLIGLNKADTLNGNIDNPIELELDGIPNANTIINDKTTNKENEEHEQRKQTFILNLRKSVDASPNKKLFRSSILYQSKIFPDAEKRNTIANLNREDIVEFIKLKEKSDRLLISIEERDQEINDKNRIIDDLQREVEYIKLDRQKADINIDQLKEEIQNINDANSLLTADYFNVMSQFNSLLKEVGECDIKDNLASINLLSNEILDEYHKDLSYVEKFSNCFSNMKSQNLKLRLNMVKIKVFEEQIKKSKADNESLANLNKIADEKMNNCEKEMTKMYILLNKYKSTQSERMEIFYKNVFDKIDNSENNLNKLKKIVEEYLTKLFTLNDHLKQNFTKAKKENDKFRIRIKELFGKSFDIECFLYDEDKVEANKLNWDKSILTKLEKKIIELKEEKRNLKGDLALLRIDFSSGLTDSTLNNKIQWLMRVKEENYKLKMELNEFKKKNEILEKKVNRLKEKMDVIMEDGNQSMNCNKANLDNSNAQSLQVTNFEENIKLRRENKELIEKISELDLKHKVREKNKFKQAMEILRNTQEVIELNRLHFTVKYKYDDSDKKEINFNQCKTMENKIIPIIDESVYDNETTIMAITLPVEDTKEIKINEIETIPVLATSEQNTPTTIKVTCNIPIKKKSQSRKTSNNTNALTSSPISNLNRKIPPAKNDKKSNSNSKYIIKKASNITSNTNNTSNSSNNISNLNEKSTNDIKVELKKQAMTESYEATSKIIKKRLDLNSKPIKEKKVDRRSNSNLPKK